MKRRIAYVIGTCGLVVLIIVVFLGHFLDPFDTTKQMDAGKKYMDSLTEKDIQTWIQRTQYYLKNPPPNFGLGPLPPELQKLGITGIEVLPDDEVDYVWLGGMDNTSLCVQKMTNGDFQVTAVYTPYSSMVIWPKEGKD